MRIADKNSFLKGALFAAVLTFSPGFAAWAAEGSASTPLALDPSPPALVEPVSVPSTVAAPATPKVVDAKAQGETIEKSLAAMENKVIETAKSTIKKLDAGGDSTSFADINQARQTVTRIDAIIDVEKRLNELEKLRNERREGSSPSTASLANAIPASALTMPSGLSAGSESNPAMRPRESRPEVTRIYGSGGKYVAVLKLAGAQNKTVKVGEKISRNETVRSITPSSIEIAGKEPYTLHVKNVDVVYSTIR